MFNHLSIHSKLALLLLAISIGSILVVADLGYINARDGLRQVVFQELTSLRNSRSRQVTAYMTFLKDQSISLSNEKTTLEAMQGFSKAYAIMKTTPVPPERDAKLKEFYAKTFLPELAKRTDGTPLLDNYYPEAPATRNLQYLYIAKNPNKYLNGAAMTSAGEPSEYDRLHAKYQPFFADFAKRFGYDDIILVDPESGDIVYSVQKTTEFATNLENGPYAQTNLAQLYQKARRSMDANDFFMVDFEHYRPSLNAPEGFVASGIFDGGHLIGILVFQFPIDALNRIMTSNMSWEKEGLGKTGESYLVGADRRIRSRTRAYWENPAAALETFRKAGVPASELSAIERMKTTLLNLTINSESTQRALAGKEGTAILTDYRGVNVLSSYAPLEVNGLHWGIVAKMDADEAFAPITQYTRTLLISSVGIILFVTLLALGAANQFVRPIRRLIDGAKQVSAGNNNVMVDVGTQDEFRDLADAFNEMTRSIKTKSEALAEKIQENESLLLNILPGPVAARMKEGKQNLSDTFADVTVLYAEIDGLQNLPESAGSAQGVLLFHDLVQTLDEAAERSGVEKIKTIGNSYLAVCGLSVQRPDHTGRAVEFAQEMTRIVRRFGQEKNLNLTVSIGINAGPVVGGVVGRNKFIYDLWGDTVTIARALPGDEEGNLIRVTDGVYQRLQEQTIFSPHAPVLVRGKGLIGIWENKGVGVSERNGTE